MENYMVYWVRFLFPGLIASNTTRKEYDHLPCPEEVEWPDGAYAFTIHHCGHILEE